MTAKHAILAAIMIALPGCSDKHGETLEQGAAPDGATEAAPPAYSDSDSNEDAMNATKDDDGQESQENPSFGGYPCTADCSGHEAGYQWAEEKSIDDPDDCSGNSDSFVEGCKAFAEEQ